MSKKITNWRKLDPFHAREKEKYGANPLPSREFILQWMGEEGKLLTFNQIISAFALDEQQSEHLSHRLKAMISAGQLTRNRQGRIGITKKMNLLTGHVVAHPEGYGFFSPEGDEPDGFIPPKYMQTLMHGDKIIARVKFVDKQGRKDYAPVEILHREQQRVVGTLKNEQGVWFVVPENRRLTNTVLVSPDKLGPASVGEIVVVQIHEYPTRNRQAAVGEVVDVLGDELAPGLEVAIAMENHNIPSEFPQAVRQQSERLPEALTDKDYQGRLDLRHLPMVTIDGITARDFDDAVYAEKRGDNYRLYVAIADVSHYVRPNAPLDEEAYLRGTSVYFPDRVIPMLPEKLSNGLCSLNPNVDRLVMVCEMTIGPDGYVRRSKFHEAVIHSHARFTYETVEKILFERDPMMRESFSALLEPLEHLKAVYEILAAARTARHTIEFNFKEAEFEYDSEGKIATIAARERLDAHKLIEECMIIANVTAAKFLEKHKMPALYRVHDDPSTERLEQLLEYVGKLGLVWRGSGTDNIEPKHFAWLLEKASERDDRVLLEKMVLRSMSQAIYTPENRGHFGLALDHYAHFTSPIRRYPDVLVHRAIRHVLRGGKASDYRYSPETMIEMGKHCSMVERRADDATRDAMDYLKCEFMSHRLGEQYHGQISNVTSFGFFVTLDEFFIDGLVHVSTLTSDYYHYDANSVSLTGERSGREFHMMDKVEIRVAKVDMEGKKIDFELISHEGVPAVKGPVNGKNPKRKSKRGDKDDRVVKKEKKGRHNGAKKGKKPPKGKAKNKAKKKGQ
ncbi:ribonuclease R [Suttonella sp. R2A3]|uniref:ribonuclease R n=1 Tax=Suttonella sp. R2A3 TaxID=2908648 RepID=UPI001F3CAE80|nr:ribonuclease R [Suttonella sp. R2A3]UJF24895.1 ribonuclease R [Suttonella sp. R2A3]